MFFYHYLHSNILLMQGLYLHSCIPREVNKVGHVNEEKYDTWLYEMAF